MHDKKSWAMTDAGAMAHEVGHAGATYGKLDTQCRSELVPGGVGCILNWENIVRSEVAPGEGLNKRTEYFGDARDKK